jgi:hypothetical protein
MKRLAYAVLPLVLAACPAKKNGGTGPVAQGAGCPSAKNVFVASYVQQDKDRSGWVMPLGSKGVSDPAEVPEYAPVDPASVGIPAAPQGTLWLITQTSAPCPLKLGRYYQARIDGPPASATYGIELDGCPAPPNMEEAGGFVLVSDASPSGCWFEAPQPIAVRLGQMDKAKQWQRPTKETPLPAPVAAIVPPHTCSPPDCEMLWAFSEIKVNKTTVAWAGAINWLQIGAPADQCSWKAERYSGFFVPTPSGAMKVTEGQTRSLALLAALTDRAGAKVLLAEGPGEFATYDVGGGLGNHVTWMVAPDDAWDAVDHLGPICDEPKP